ncbi:MAG: hypothetical protein PHW52_05190, partial [Candidatus Pacebacteria bacterium]|nr:hypothetical protein [Candidatus Paceibacterota bacterium]
LAICCCSTARCIMSGLAIELLSQRCRRRLETWIVSLDWIYSLPHEELRLKVLSWLIVIVIKNYLD